MAHETQSRVPCAVPPPPTSPHVEEEKRWFCWAECCVGTAVASLPLVGRVGVGGFGAGQHPMTEITPDTRANARRLRTDATPQERRLWVQLREVNRMLGMHFRRQAPIGRFIADFADYGRRLVVEVDGGQHGGCRDVARDAWLTEQGFVVLRFWNNEVDGNIEGVMRVVLDALEAADAGVGAGAPPPQPSPTGGEGGAPSVKLRQVERLGTYPPPRGEGLGVGGLASDQKDATQ